MSKRFRLNLVNAAEDVPRVITAYGRACGGEVALVLRPTESRGVMVHLTKDGAYGWTAISNDAPNVPREALDPAEAVARIKEAQLKPGRQGPITLRGQWSGHLHCDGQVPIVELRRKLATYAILTIRSDPQGHWRWTVERLERWFGGAGSDQGEAKILLHAIEAGLGSAMGLLGQVCSQRDSKRRGAFDPAWAEKYPVRPAKERPSSTRRLTAKPRRRAKRGAPKRTSEPTNSETARPKAEAKAAKPVRTSKTRASTTTKRATASTRPRRATKRPTGKAPSNSTTAANGNAQTPKSRRVPRTTKRGDPSAKRGNPSAKRGDPSAKRTTAPQKTSAKARKLPAKARQSAPPASPDQALLAAFEQAIQSAISEVS